MTPEPSMTPVPLERLTKSVNQPAVKCRLIAKLSAWRPERPRNQHRLQGRTAAAGSVALVLTLLAGASLAQAPDRTWNRLDTSDTLAEVADCTGAANQSDDAVFNEAGSGKLCQNYTDTAAGPTDLYETLRPEANGFCDADIEFYRVGKDSDFFYFEIQTTGSWNCDNLGASREYVVELDLDSSATASPEIPHRYDIYYRYFPDVTHVLTGCDIDVNNCDWIASDEVAPIQSFRDESSATAQMVGSTDADECDSPAEPTCSGGSGLVSGYEADWKDYGGMGSSSYNWYRILPRFDPTDGVVENVVQLAIRANTICVPPETVPCTQPTDTLSRVWAGQNSSIGPTVLMWHDHQKSADLPTWDVDNCCALGGATTPVTLASFRAEGFGGRAEFHWSTATEAGRMDMVSPSKVPFKHGDTEPQ